MRQRHSRDWATLAQGRGQWVGCLAEENRHHTAPCLTTPSLGPSPAPPSPPGPPSSFGGLWDLSACPPLFPPLPHFPEEARGPDARGAERARRLVLRRRGVLEFIWRTQLAARFRAQGVGESMPRGPRGWYDPLVSKALSRFLRPQAHKWGIPRVDDGYTASYRTAWSTRVHESGRRLLGRHTTGSGL